MQLSRRACWVAEFGYGLGVIGRRCNIFRAKFGREITVFSQKTASFDDKILSNDIVAATHVPYVFFIAVNLLFTSDL